MNWVKRLLLTMGAMGLLSGCIGTEMQSRTPNSVSASATDGKIFEYDILGSQYDAGFKVTHVNDQEIGDWVRLESGARVRITEDGRVRYNPRQIYNNLAPGESYSETLTFRLVDLNGNTGSASFTIEFAKDGDAPSPAPPVAEEPAPTPEPEPPIVEQPPIEEPAPMPMPMPPEEEHEHEQPPVVEEPPAEEPTPMPPMPPESHDEYHFRITQGTSQSATAAQMYRASETNIDAHGSRHQCVVSHYSYDDPVVFPGQTGAAHLHMFFGNTAVDAFTTSQNIRQTGNSSCQGGTLNRSSYWAPAMFNENNQVVLPNSHFTYYKSWVSNRNELRPIPVGLQMLASRSVLNADDGRFHFDDHDGITLSVDFPNCVAVDGNGNPILSSPGGTSHLAYSFATCPASHPYMIPTMSMNINYRMNFYSGWYLASDSSPATQGQSLHADYIAGWEETAMEQITQCVREARRECNWFAQGYEERYYSPTGERIYQWDFEFMPGISNTPLPMLPKNIGDPHGHHGH